MAANNRSDRKKTIAKQNFAWREILFQTEDLRFPEYASNFKIEVGQVVKGSRIGCVAVFFGQKYPNKKTRLKKPRAEIFFQEALRPAAQTK